MTSFCLMAAFAWATGQPSLAEAPRAVISAAGYRADAVREINQQMFWRRVPSERFRASFIRLEGREGAVYVDRLVARPLLSARVATEAAKLDRLGTFHAADLPEGLARALQEMLGEMSGKDTMGQTLSSPTGRVAFELEAGFRVTSGGKSQVITRPVMPYDEERRNDAPVVEKPLPRKIGWPPLFSERHDVSWDSRWAKRITVLTPPDLGSQSSLDRLKEAIDLLHQSLIDADRTNANALGALAGLAKSLSSPLENWDGKNAVGWDDLSAKDRDVLRNACFGWTDEDLKAARLEPAQTYLNLSFRTGRTGDYAMAISFNLNQPYPPKRRRP